VGGGKGLESKRKKNTGEEVNTREARRKKTGDTAELSLLVKDMEIPLLIGYKDLGGNITLRRLWLE